MNRRKPGRTEPVPPLAQCLVSLHAFHSLARHHNLLDGAGAGEELVKLENRVNGDGLVLPEVEHGGVKIGEAVGDEATVLEPHVNILRQLRELPPDLLEVVGVVRGGRSDSGEAESGRAAGAKSKSLDQRRPLHPLVDSEIDDVDAALPLERFQDGLVGGEVRELEVRPGLVEVNLKPVGERVLERENPVDTPRERLREEPDLLHQCLRNGEVVALHGLRARSEGVNQPDPVLLGVNDDHSTR
ncbi:hypothetical protein CR513_00793, partial [Mucuna pruriens]